MEEYSSEDLREFLEEIQEHILKMEQDLLILEDNPGDVDLLNECFRHMHSIKGACGYMGFLKASGLAHALENVFDRIRNGDLEPGPRVFDAIFKGMDLLKEFTESIDVEQGRAGAEPEGIDALLDELDMLVSKEMESGGPKVDFEVTQPPSDIQEGPSEEVEAPGEVEDEDKIDQELMEVFRDEMTTLLERFEHEIREGDGALGVLEEMERLINYVGHEKALDAVEDIKSLVQGKGDLNQLLDDKRFHDLYQGLIQLLPFEYTSRLKDEGASSEEEFDEDQELYNIFIDFVREKTEPLRNIPASLDEDWAMRCQEAIEAIKSSASYMDYREVVRLLEEWEERLTELLTECGGKDDAYCRAPLRELWEGLIRLLPELAETGQGGGGEGPRPELLEEVEEVVDDAKGTVDDLTPSTHDSAHGARDKGVIIDSFTRSGPFEPSSLVKRGGSGGMDLEGAIRIPPERVDSLVVDVGELAVIRTGTLRLFDELRMLYTRWLERGVLPPRHLKALKEMVLRFGEHASRLDSVSKGLQDQVLGLRMVPIAQLFQRITRQVRDLSRRLGKEVDLEFEGQETTLDKQVMGAIQDPLMHIIRNAMDHGIESADEREAAGKPQKGRLLIQAFHEGNYVVIKVVDDGRGIDRERVIERAIQKGLVEERDLRGAARQRALELIFLPGMTTKESVSETSGRGVGLDVVKKNIESLGGMIAVGSQPGKGTSFSIKIPLTLAIIPVLLMELGGQKIGVPMAAIEKTLRVYRDQVSMAEGQEIITVRQRPVPLVRLERLFKGLQADETRERLLLVLVRHGEIEAAINADAFLGQHDLVIKPLEEYLIEGPGFSGVATLGDGSVALILDVAAVLNRAGLWFKALPVNNQ